jgi:regulator of protease activity HflC (stomatin/prohibitin superfamily)
MQDPFDGELHFWKDPGTYFQNFGRVTKYKKSSQYWFSAKADEGESKDQSIRVRFNDGGHANVSGSLRFDLPLDDVHLRTIHTRYGSQAAIEQDLIRTVVSKAVYMTGPLMSSKESYAEKRSDMIQDIGDQVSHGVYKTETEEVRETDPLSGKEKTVSIVKLMKGADGTVLRQEASPLEALNIKASNFTINEVTYDEVVEKQITQQQEALMQVQTAMAEARKAEQSAITAEKEGQAAAAKAKWEQEVLKAKAVTEAEQKKAVAELNMNAAEFTKKEQILLGEGEAARKRAVMDADGALDKKLTAWVEVNKAYAAELGKQRWVPEVQMGQGSGNTGPDIMDFLKVKTAQDLALNIRMQPGPGAQK